VTHLFRLAVCATALVTGLWYFSGATAAPPTLPKDTYKKVIEADIKLMKDNLDWIAKNWEDANAKAAARSVKTLAVMLVTNAETTGDQALRDQAMKIAESAGKLEAAVKPRPAMRVQKTVEDEAKALAELAGKLSSKPGAAPLKPTDPHKMKDFDLEHVMTPFRPGMDPEGGNRGGANIEKDIRDMVAKDRPPLKVDPAAVEILAARTALMLEYAIHHPNDKAKVNPGNEAEWAKLSKDSVELSQKIAAEAAKGKSADTKEIVKMLDALNGKCYKCHSVYRDE
jgi:hypothetical protein